MDKMQKMQENSSIIAKKVNIITPLGTSIKMLIPTKRAEHFMQPYIV